ncbi:FtsJ-like methyltransferase [Chrysochromulina ericina virus CeV-01B]|uniref:FtsJ-like methyltransferase n=1 Tax=Chrysochromulina ericina virus CeV-01B TaxID=3070830 RepID=A0A0N9R198_9VIRU|nr:FtsJ-like methyltransferase [Chrysochromulina ericina virus]ALH23207.1 FtsJ-like methyltransferase [Chrysochromulina ericina virus CeV-01B]
MSYFLLPNIINTISSEDVEIKKDLDHYTISKSLARYLNSMKTQIDNYTNEWDQYKKYTNPYEYIHTQIPYSKLSVCKLKPLSRSFYKLIEIFNIFNIDFKSDPITSFHLAEGPGGFVEALITYRENNNTINSKDIYYGMTLINDEDENIPGWKKSKYFLNKNQNVKIITGKDNTGNLLNVDNLWHCYYNYNNSIDLITGDGGFDFSTNFNQQEHLSVNLIFCQIVYAIAMQKKGGMFILKIFDIFTQITVELLYILSSLYEKCYIVKPHTSRSANAEKYIICRNFKLDNTYDLIKKFSELFTCLDDKPICKILNIQIPYLYINKIEDINAILGQQQLENILSTLNILDNNKPDKLDTIKKNNILKCIQYCIKNKLPYHKNINQHNMFIPT